MEVVATCEASSRRAGLCLPVRTEGEQQTAPGRPKKDTFSMGSTAETVHRELEVLAMCVPVDDARTVLERRCPTGGHILLAVRIEAGTRRAE